MPEYDDNPAGRLRAVLIEVHQMPPNMLAWDAMVKVLAPEASPSSPEALRAMTLLLELPAGIRAAVDALDEDEEEKEHLLEHLDKVEAFLASVANRNLNLQQALPSFAAGGDVPNSAAVQSLGTCSRRLHRYSPEPVIPREEVDALIQSVTSLMVDIRASSLDNAAKLLLLHHLHRLLQDLELIRITGAAPVEESLDAFLVALSRNPEARQEAERQGFTERLAVIASTVRRFFDIARGVRQLGTETHAVIEQGAQAIEQARNLLS
ncbi:hypothetical protein ACWD3J_33950 [Streptomyces sp. NPDC002755]|uniref:hypothetical protein n=1 Tax=Streptomyces sp. NPDC002884 TaxID=3154544 RepID=UPI003325856E